MGFEVCFSVFTLFVLLLQFQPILTSTSEFMIEKNTKICPCMNSFSVILVGRQLRLVCLRLNSDGIGRAPAVVCPSLAMPLD